MNTRPRTTRSLLQIVLAAAFAAAAAAALAEDLTQSLQAEGLLVWYARGSAKWAQLAAEAFPDANKFALDTVGITANRTVSVHLYATTDGYEGAINHSMRDTLGVAIPSSNTIVIDCSRADLRGPNGFLLTLRHEMIHIAIGRVEARTGHRVPLWFNEGVATCYAHRLREDDPTELVLASYLDSLFPLKDLEHSFPAARMLRELAYQQAESTVQFLLERFGKDAVRQVVRRMEDGATFDEALSAVTGGIDFEGAWKKHIAGRYHFLSFLNLVSLFTVAALLAILAYVIYRFRRHRIRREWAEEERMLYGPEEEDDDSADESAEEDDEGDRW